MARTPGTKNGRRMGRLQGPPLTAGEESEKQQLDWELIVRGSDTLRLLGVRRALFEEGADLRLVARSFVRLIDSGDVAALRLWFEVMGLLKNREGREQMLALIQQTAQVILPFVPVGDKPRLLAALQEEFGEAPTLEASR